VFIVYHKDLEAIRDNAALAKELTNVLAHKIIPARKPESATKEVRGIPNAVEIESAAVVLGLTPKEELTGELTGRAIMLQRIMSQLVGSHVDPASLAALMGGNILEFARRIEILLERLVPLAINESSREFRVRRRALRKSL